MIEIELKFQVPPARARRAGARAGHRARRERAAAAGALLRHRRPASGRGPPGAAPAQEGRRWVQTLKGARRRPDAAAGARGAAGARAPATAPALATRRATTARAAGRALARRHWPAGGGAWSCCTAPTIRRTARGVLRCDGARIEVALDVGEVASPADRRWPVCEVEFELLAGPPQALLALAARWAARFGLVLDVTHQGRARAAAGRRRPARRRVRCMRRRRPCRPAMAWRQARCGDGRRRRWRRRCRMPRRWSTAAAADPSTCTSCASALRRLRTVLRRLRPRADAGARTQALAGRCSAGSARARDADVLAPTLAPALAAAGGRRPARLPAAQRRAAAATAPARAARSRDQRRPVAAHWSALAARAGRRRATQRPWAAAAARRCCGAGAGARATAGARLAMRLDDRRRGTALRKRLKRLRYLLEFCAAAVPAEGDAATAGGAAPGCRTSLGHWNDLRAGARGAGWRGLRPTRPRAVRRSAGWRASAVACDRATARPLRRPGGAEGASACGAERGRASGRAGSSANAAATVGTICSAPSSSSKPLRADQRQRLLVDVGQHQRDAALASGRGAAAPARPAPRCPAAPGGASPAPRRGCRAGTCAGSASILPTAPKNSEP